MECVSTTSYSIALNGCFQGFFKGQQGLRQGDLMSPLLFTLCLEYLVHSLNCRTNSNFNYHPKCAALKITHLAFTDDLLIF